MTTFSLFKRRQFFHIGGAGLVGFLGGGAATVGIMNAHASPSTQPSSNLTQAIGSCDQVPSSIQHSKASTQGNATYLHPGTYDQSFLSKPADVKQIWDFTTFEQVQQGSSAVRNALNDFHFLYQKTLYPVAVMRGELAIICTLDDIIWSKYHLSSLLDSTVTVPTDSNPLYYNRVVDNGNPPTSSQGSFYTSTTLQALQQRGLHISVCHQALSGFATNLAEQHRLTAQSVYEELATHLVPGAQQTPSGSSLIAVAQHLGFTYAKQ